MRGILIGLLLATVTPADYTAGQYPQHIGKLICDDAASSCGELDVAPFDIITGTCRITGFDVADNFAIRFNGDSGANYWSRSKDLVLSSALTSTSASACKLGSTTATLPQTFHFTIMNHATSTKGVSFTGVQTTGNAASSGNAWFGACEWVNSTDQIVKLEMVTFSGSSLMNAGSECIFYGR